MVTRHETDNYVTQAEYGIAIALEREGRAPAGDLSDYWQLIRFYRGDTFRRDAAERALLRIRALRALDRVWTLGVY